MSAERAIGIIKSPEIITPEHAAEILAQQLLENPKQRDYYDTFKRFLIGAGDREQRTAEGRRPWPTREVQKDLYNPEQWAFTEPVCAGFSNEGDERSALAILRDPWHDVYDTEDWLVGRLDIDSGNYIEYLVTAVKKDAVNNVSLQIVDPQRYYNMPPGMRSGPDQPMRDWQRVSFRIGRDGLTTEATMHVGTQQSRTFHEIEYLQRALDGHDQQLAEVHILDAVARGGIAKSALGELMLEPLSA